MAKTKKKPKSVWDVPENSEDCTVTLRMLKLVENQLESRFDSTDSKIEQVNAKFRQIDARFDQVDARFAQMEARFDQIDKRFEEIDKRFEEVDAKFKQVDARFDRLETKIDQFQSDVMTEIARIAILVEQQRNENRIVLEGYGLLREKNADLDRRLTLLENPR